MASSNQFIPAPATYKVLDDFASYTTAHGVGRVFASKSRFLRFMWAATFFASFVYATIQAVKHLNKFYEYPTDVNILLSYESLEFPAVTICNKNPFRASRLYELGIEYNSIFTVDTDGKTYPQTYDANGNSNVPDQDQISPQKSGDRKKTSSNNETGGTTGTPSATSNTAIESSSTTET